jgi:hypothetical protein
MDISDTLSKIKGINLRGGIFGKTTTLLIVLTVSVAAVCIAVRVYWTAIVLMLPLMAMIFYALKRCFDFAQANPQAAIMEGAELLIHEKLMFSQKHKLLNHTVQATVVDHPPPALPAAEFDAPDEIPIENEVIDENAGEEGA